MDAERERVKRNRDNKVQQLHAGLSAVEQQYTQESAELDRQWKASNAERLAALVSGTKGKLTPLVHAFSDAPTRSIATDIKQVLSDGLIQEAAELEPHHSTSIVLLVLLDTFCEVALTQRPEAVNTLANGTCCIEDLAKVRAAMASPVTLHAALLALENAIAVVVSRDHGPIHERYARRWRVVCTRDPEALAKFDADEAAAKQPAFAASYVPPAGARVG
jgi:hypothetical protein